jgi:hypothetical protein
VRVRRKRPPAERKILRLHWSRALPETNFAQDDSFV